MPSGAIVTVSLAGVLASACVQVPPFQPPDAGDGGTELQMVAVMEDHATGEVHVTGAGYTMRFSAQGGRFPDLFDVGGEPFLGSASECGDEHGMGIALRPVYRVNGEDVSGTIGDTAAAIPLRGPHVGQVSIAWDAKFDCGGTFGKLAGTSTFSFFPDGRLTRFDRVSSPEGMSACYRCGASASSLLLGSYTTLTVDTDAELYPVSMPSEQYGYEWMPGKTACVGQRGRSVAFAWPDAMTRLRILGTTSSQSIAFIKDVYAGSPLPAEEWQTTTQMGVSTSEGCEALVARIDPFTHTSLDINGTKVSTASGAGIFGGENGGLHVSFPVAIQGWGSEVTAVPAGFAVWLTVPAIPENLTLTHSGGHTETSWYRLQPVGQRDLVVWFDVPLASGETITIDGT